jgi:hypothetical protein
MAEQTVEAGTVAVVLVNVIDDDGHHVAATIDTTTTRLQKGDATDTTWNSVVPTVDTIATGVYRIEFSSLSPAIVVDDNDELIRVKINGTIAGTAWTEYHMPLKVLTAGGGGGGGDATAANQTTIINHLTDVKGTSFVKDTHSLTDITADVTGLNGDVMRGTDGANTIAPDNTSIAAILVDTGTTIPNSISALNDFDPALDTVANVTTVGSVTNPVTTDTASRDASKADVSGLSTFNASTDTVTTDAASRTASQADVSALATSASIAALNDLSSTDVENAVWDSSYASHVIAGTFGKLMDQLRKANQAIDGQVSGTPTASAFDSNITGYTTGAFDAELLLFVSGPLLGESRPVLSYNATNGRLTFEEPFTAAPSASDEFVILPQHIHPISEIAGGVRSEMDSASTQLAAIAADTNELQTDWTNGGRLDLILDSVLALLDDARSEPGQGSPPVNPDAMTKLDYLYKAWRNKKTQTATTFSLFDDAGTTVDHKSTVSDDGTTATIGEIATGP